MIFSKIRRLTKKVFSSKTYMLLGINKFVPDEFGEVTDISVDREEKIIYLELVREGSKGSLKILNYALMYEGSQAYLTLDKIEKEGYLKPLLKKAKIDKKIKIDPKYVKIVERMV